MCCTLECMYRSNTDRYWYLPAAHVPEQNLTFRILLMSEFVFQKSETICIVKLSIELPVSW